MKPGGRLVYITCSVLPEENRDQVEAFMARFPGFELLPWQGVWEDAGLPNPPASADGAADTLLMSPRTFGTDGFFVAALRRLA